MNAPHYQDADVTLYHGDCLNVLRELPDNSVDSVVTDPPYGLANTTPRMVAETITAWISGDREYLPGGSGFMGKAWDAFVPPVAVWDECMRVLKPGGHLLAFSGSRTLDLMSLGIRLAGFEIRDNIAWLYGSGFPKSRNVTAEMERYLADGPTNPEAAIREGVYAVTGYLRAARDKAGWTNKRIDELFGTNGMAGHWTTSASQPAVPSVRQWETLKEALAMGDDMDELVAELAATERPEDWGEGESKAEFLGALRNNPEAEGAGGWGTALKPAFEPVVVARKSPVGTTSANVRAYGTGALNIDGCRIGDDVRINKPGSTAPRTAMGDGWRADAAPTVAAGRWPTNVVLDESQAVELDKQSGVLTSGVMRSGTPRAPRDGAVYGRLEGDATTRDTYGDSGGASRFFPTFRYEPKAPTSERPKVGEVMHPTVKPLDLMRWLIRLVTPPGGVVLEPFAGSGTTAEACVVEGFQCIAIEREPDYLPLITQRLTKPIEPVLDFGGVL